MEENQEPLRIRHEDLPPESPLPLNRPPAPERISGLAIASLALGVLSVLFAGVAIGPIAMICGLIAVLYGRGVPGRGQIAAFSGIVLGLCGTALWAVLIWYWTVHSTKGPTELGARSSPPVSVGRLDRTAIQGAPEVIKRALLSNVSVLVERRAGTDWTPVSSGSGTVILRDHDRYHILTCRHVLPQSASEGSDWRVRVLWVGGEGAETRIEWQAGPPFDFALLVTLTSTGAEAPSIAPIGDSRTMNVSEAVFAVGDPANYRTSYATGVLSAARTIREGSRSMRVFQAQVPINPGNSGGGLYNGAGELIAVNSWKVSDPIIEGIGFSIAIENLWVAIEDAPPSLARLISALAPAGAAAPAVGSTHPAGEPDASSKGTNARKEGPSWP